MDGAQQVAVAELPAEQGRKSHQAAGVSEHMAGSMERAAPSRRFRGVDHAETAEQRSNMAAIAVAAFG